MSIPVHSNPCSTAALRTVPEPHIGSITLFRSRRRSKDCRAISGAIRAGNGCIGVNVPLVCSGMVERIDTGIRPEEVVKITLDLGQDLLGAMV